MARPLNSPMASSTLTRKISLSEPTASVLSCVGCHLTTLSGLSSEGATQSKSCALETESVAVHENKQANLRSVVFDDTGNLPDYEATVRCDSGQAVSSDNHINDRG